MASAAAARTLAHVNAELERLATGIRSRARLVISADHSHADVLEPNRRNILNGDPLLELLKAPPTGEPRVPLFHVRDGCQAAFEELFQKRFGDDFVLLPMAQVESLKLLGPQPLSPLARHRFGDYLGIALQPQMLKYKSSKPTTKPENIGHHAGLFPAEMRIPLIVV